MKLAPVAVWVTLLAASNAFAQAAPASVEQSFEGPLAREQSCSFLLEARQRAEIGGRLDFAARVESVGTTALPTLIARVSPGTPHAIRRIDFAGHRHINDQTLRRSLKTFEREMLNVQQLRRSLTHINSLGVFEPLTLADVLVTRLDDVTVDLTIQLRERKRRWWSISGVPLPVVNPLQASLGMRLPGWGSGLLEMATYFVSLNVVGLGRPFFAFGRPLIAGQEWLSGFAITSSLSPRAMATHYGRTHAVHTVSRMLDLAADDSLTVDIASPDGSEQPPLVCKPDKPRLWWLRLAATQLLNSSF